MKYQLLLVDDDAAVRALIRHYCKSLSTEFAIAEEVDSRSGLDYLNNNMVGLEFLNKLREQKRFNELPIIMLTGEGNETIAVEAIKRGASDYLVKEAMTKMSLQRVITHAIDLGKARSERRHAEAQLSLSEARYRDLFENAHDLIQSVSVDGRFVYVNQAWRGALGYDQSDIDTLSMFDVIHPDRRNHYRQLFTQLAAGNDVGTVETQFVSKDGRILTVEGSVNCRIEDGKPTAIRGIFRDVTAVRQVQQELKLRSVAAEAATDGIVISDACAPDQPIIYASRAFLDLVGYDKDEVLGKNCRFLQGEGTEKAVVNQLKQALATGQSFCHEILNYRKNGEAFWNLLRIEPLKDATGNIQYFVGTQTDVTKRINMEQALFAEKERLQITLESIGDGVISTDSQGQIEFMNPVAESLTGWMQVEVHGKPIEHVYQLIAEDNQAALPNPVTLCLQQGCVPSLPNNSVLVNRGGQNFAVKDSVAPIRGSTGTLLGAVLVFQDVTKARGLAQKIHHQASHDALTGLINRTEFERRLQNALDSAKDNDQHHVLCFLDLDNFKIINDTAGHIAGDALLKQVAHQLSTLLRARDGLARLGGDEFSILMEDCELEDAQSIVEDLIATVRRLRFTWNEQIYEIGISVGMVSISADAESTAQLLAQADVACYSAKGQGRNRVAIYHAEDGDSAHRHQELLRAASLRTRLENDDFYLYAQPICPLKESPDSAAYFEVLLRLRDADGLLLKPGAVIPAAERYNLMGSIDRWVIETALQQYDSVFGKKANTRIAVNLSGNSLTDDELLRFVDDQLVRSGVSAGNICFEITETAAISHLAQATKLINGLKELGTAVALDDFGSGLSSFCYLKQFPVDYLKIDGSFMRGVVNDPADRAMVESINHIGHVMGLQTIAEWVETDEILEQVNAIGVDYVQGFAIGVPQPLESVNVALHHPRPEKVTLKQIQSVEKGRSGDLKTYGNRRISHGA